MENKNKNKNKKKRIVCIFLFVVLNFGLLGYLISINLINKQKLDILDKKINAISKINFNKKIRTCNIIAKKEFKKMSLKIKDNKSLKDREKDIMNELRLKCLYSEGYNLNFANNKQKNIVKDKVGYKGINKKNTDKAVEIEKNK